MACDRHSARLAGLAAVLLAVVLPLAGCTAERASRPAPGPGKLAWRLLADAPTQRTEVAAAAEGDHLWVAGGFGRDGSTVATVERYDLDGDRWERGPDLPVAVNHAMAASLDGSLYVVGGWEADGAVGRRAFRLAGGNWRAVAELPEGRAAGVAVALDGRLYVAAGVGPHGLAGSMLVYDPGGDRWTFEQAEAFDVRARQWRSLPPLPTPRHGLGAVGVGTVLYTLAGGPRPGLNVSAASEAIDLAPLRR